jgi:hypothetical protein
MSQLTQGNIIREKAVSVIADDFEDAQGFFIRATTGGVITYVPLNNQDDEPVTKTIEASVLFNDPVMVRKICKEVETSPATSYASGIYVGYGR